MQQLSILQEAQGQAPLTWATKAGSQAAALIAWMPRSISPVRFTRASLDFILVLVAASMRLASHLLMGTSSSTTASPPRNASRTCRM